VELLPSSNAVKSYREDTQKMPYREILISIKEIYTWIRSNECRRLNVYGFRRILWTKGSV